MAAKGNHIGVLFALVVGLCTHTHYAKKTESYIFDFFSVLAPVVVILYLAAKYFPLFACMHAPIPLMGHTLGLVYSCLL